MARELRKKRRCTLPSEMTEAQEKEYRRWRGYANALLLALTVLFAGTAIAFPAVIAPLWILSTVFGLAGILLAVLWFALESAATIRGKPAFLILASCAFGFQVGFLFLALVVSYALK